MLSKEPERIPKILVCGAIAAIILGVIGWQQAIPGITILDALYRSLQMFVFDFSVEHIPVVLNIARWIAAAVALVAVVKVVAAVLSHQFRLYRAGRRTKHTVIAGSGPEVEPLARRLVPESLLSRKGQGHRVNVIGNLSEDAAAQLAASKIPVFPGLSDAKLNAVLKGAKKVIIVGSSDEETASLIARFRKARLDTTPLALFHSPALTRQWLKSQQGGVRPVCRTSQVALETLRRCPPFPRDAAVPDPIVVGKGDLAAELVRRIITGWQHDGWVPRVHCIADERCWADDLVDEFGPAVVVHQLGFLSPRCVAQKVAELSAAWTAPPPGKGTACGVRVYLALDSPSDGTTIADQLLRSSAARVGLIVDIEHNWRELFTGFKDRLELFSRDTLLADPEVLYRGEPELLRDELIRDAESWPPDSPTLFGRIHRDAAGKLCDVSRLDERLQQGVEILVAGNAAAIRAVAERGGLVLQPGGALTAPPVLGPSQLTAMSEELLKHLRRVLPDDASDSDITLWGLELSSRLPGMLHRAGWTVTSEKEEMLTMQDVSELARWVHFAYVRKQDELGNATGSELAKAAWDGLSGFDQASNRAVVLDYPVKLAAVGLDWRTSPSPAPYNITDEATLAVLAEAEHRRWSHYQRRNGRPGHRYNVPWEELTEAERALDLDIVKNISEVLAHSGVEIFDPRA